MIIIDVPNWAFIQWSRTSSVLTLSPNYEEQASSLSVYLQPYLHGDNGRTQITTPFPQDTYDYLLEEDWLDWQSRQIDDWELIGFPEDFLD